MKLDIQNPVIPGKVVLIGSGETSPTGQKVFHHLFSQLPFAPRVAVLETAAGFELNSAQVAGRIGTFLEQHLSNFHPKVEQIAARRRGTPDSPDEPEVVAPLLAADVIFMGPGSPSYAVRQLSGSLAWDLVAARHRLGAAVVLASAGVIASGALSLPVYEIYKVGEDPHWKPGLDFLGAFGLKLALVPHWNNQEGGAGLDTRFCFMGTGRFEALQRMLPGDVTVTGIDENTALEIDLQAQACIVLGSGQVTIRSKGEEHRFSSGDEFPASKLGTVRMPEPGEGISGPAWQQAVAAQAARKVPAAVPEDVQALVDQREAARGEQDWAKADRLRQRIAELGWMVKDTPQGARLERSG